MTCRDQPDYDAATHVFDPLHAYWESETNRKVVTVLRVVSSLVLIELNRQGLLSASMQGV